DPEDAAVELVRDRDDALEDVERDGLDGVLVDAGRGEVDERQPELGGVVARDSLARRDPLVDERAGERTGLAGAAAREGELVGGDETGRAEQVDEQLDRLRDAERRGRSEARAGADERRRPQAREIGLAFSHESSKSRQRSLERGIGSDGPEI